MGCSLQLWHDCCSKAAPVARCSIRERDLLWRGPRILADVLRRLPDLTPPRCANPTMSRPAAGGRGTAPAGGTPRRRRARPARGSGRPPTKIIQNCECSALPFNEGRLLVDDLLVCPHVGLLPRDLMGPAWGHIIPNLNLVLLVWRAHQQREADRATAGGRVYGVTRLLRRGEE